MKRKYFYTVIFLFAAIFSFSCKTAKKKEPTIPETKTGILLDERLSMADSLVVVFYKDPYGQDSLRYTRYYTQSSVIDSLSLTQLNLQTKELFTASEKRSCRNEGKVWCFTKGKIFQTLYFSTQCNFCCYVYLIKDGIFFYSRILPSFADWLRVQKGRSIELKNDGVE